MAIKLFVPTLALSVFAGVPAAQAAATVTLDHLAAKVVIVPEARANITAEARRGKGDLPLPVLKAQGADLLVTGGLPESAFKSCSRRGHGDDGSVRLADHKSVRVADLPVLVIRTPLDVKVVANGAVIGQIGSARAVELVQQRCGEWRLGDVSGKLKADIEGMGAVEVGATGSTDLKVEGMGSVRVKSAGALNASVEGMSKVEVGEVSGPVDVSLDGMGLVKIDRGHATAFRASLDGMGSIKFGGVADSLEAEADGVGGIHVAQVRGPVHKSGSGLARVRVGGR
jgi:hypothetical protein